MHDYGQAQVAAAHTAHATTAVFDFQPLWLQGQREAGTWFADCGLRLWHSALVTLWPCPRCLKKPNNMAHVRARRGVSAAARWLDPCQTSAACDVVQVSVIEAPESSPCSQRHRAVADVLSAVFAPPWARTRSLKRSPHSPAGVLRFRLAAASGQASALLCFIVIACCCMADRVARVWSEADASRPKPRAKSHVHGGTSGARCRAGLRSSCRHTVLVFCFPSWLTRWTPGKKDSRALVTHWEMA